MDFDRAAADFLELGERAARRNLRVGYEALAWGRHIRDHRGAWEIVRRADHPNMILDSFHTLSRKIEVSSIRWIPKEKIFIVQLADAPSMTSSTRPALFALRSWKTTPAHCGYR